MIINILPSLILFTVIYLTVISIMLLLNFFKVTKFKDFNRLLLITTMVFIVIIIILFIISIFGSTSNNSNEMAILSFL
ncbi:hypothetical protein JYG23_04240 [Sedimentibacter sp. zth1]|uniref:hypothetical protein n=1 Tax=Sedimentibacter sp. zth1 TaxID=2816908 RepID=UPI001A92D7EE|nr:hypothetical protein [Sedimentibacter sp. zth1]QSX06671.1 hypothetical protein JYG23_04240 [Sedimentibacter sp. zth1]